MKFKYTVDTSSNRNKRIKTKKCFFVKPGYRSVPAFLLINATTIPHRPGMNAKATFLFFKHPYQLSF